jgi:cystathionine gamma-lyase
MSGHSDLLFGHVAMRDPKLNKKIDQWRTLTGAALGPMEAWLALRSIATLPLRLERSCENAQRIVEFLASRKEVTSVLYPGLPSHPGHEIAKKQMRYFGPVLSFVLRDKTVAERFLSKSTLLTDATSFGGVTTTAERRAKWGGDAVPDGFIRMSAGCEAVEDLIEDMTQALDAVR